MTDLKPPVRACRLVLDIQADTPEEMANSLESIGRQILMEQLSTGVSGSPSCGYQYSYTKNDRPTHDEYVALNKAYVDQLMANRQKSGETP